MNTSTFEGLIERFYALLQKSQQDVAELGAILLKLVTDDSTVLTRILKEAPVPVSKVTLERLLSVGQKRLHPALYFDFSVKAKRVGSMPFDEQEQLFRDGVRVATFSGAKIVFVVKTYATLTKHDAFVLCGIAKFRSEREQRAYIKAHPHEKKKADISVEEPVYVKAGKLVVSVPTTFTVEQLTFWMNKLRGR